MIDRFAVKKRLTAAVKVLSLSATVGPLIFISLAAKCDSFWKVFQWSLWHWPSINLPLFWDVWVDYLTAARGGRCISATPEAKPLRPLAFFSSLLPSIHSSSFVLLNKKQAGVPLAERMNVGEAEWVWQEETFLHVSIGGIWEVHLKALAVPLSRTSQHEPWPFTNRKATVSQTITFNRINPFLSKNKHSCNKQTKRKNSVITAQVMHYGSIFFSSASECFPSKCLDV